MEAREYLKLATDKTEAGYLIEENNLTEAIVKMLENYALIRVKNCSIPVVSVSLPTLDVDELNELIEKFNNTDQELMDFIGSVWNKAYTLGCIDGSKSNYR